MSFVKSSRKVYFYVLILVILTGNSFSQSDIPLDLKRARGIEMLETVKTDLKKNYYDPNFRGIDIETSYKKAKDEIKLAKRSGQVNAIISQFLMDLDDSHTFFIPDEKIGFVEYGFDIQMIGNTCYVSSVQKGSDAEQKGLLIGDVVISFETFEITRENKWKIDYFYKTLSPQEIIRLSIQKPSGSLVELQIKAKLIKWDDYNKQIEEARYKKKDKSTNSKDDPVICKEINSETVACRLESFSVDKSDIDRLMKNTKDKKALVLDLRGNGGGFVDTLKYFLGYFFDKELKIGVEKKRNRNTDVWAKTKGEKQFIGKLAVLVDSSSASASEIFARVIQLENRGIVFGDQTAGAVMESIGFSNHSFLA